MERDFLKLPIQNIPIRTKIGREIRDMFTPPPGTVMVHLDFSAEEIRIVTNLMREYRNKS